MRGARAALGVLLVAASCGGKPANQPACQLDKQCGAAACVSGVCLARAAPPASWDVEIAPPTASATGLTELTDATGSADAFDLTATAKLTLTGTVTLDSAAAAPLEAAHVVLRLPSLIAGRPELQYETDVLPPAGGASSTTFTLAVPAATLGRPGTLEILPTAPNDATVPPATLAVNVATALPITLPSKTLTVRGRVLSALGDPVTGLVARAFSSGALVSNVVTTNGTSEADRGTFTLVVRVGDDGTAPPLTVELEPAMSDAPQPRFWTKPVPSPSSATDLGEIHMPAYGPPTTFTFTFVGDGGTVNVTDAVVRARTVLADDDPGTIDFLRSGVTDAAGEVSLELLPGSTNAKRPYDIAVVPPAGSPYATTCLEMFPVVTGGLQPATMLARRASVAGVVVGSDGTPVPSVVVVATRTSGDRTTRCDKYAAPPQAFATTARDGTFALSLDPGTYTMDFDPPAGEPYPRLTQTGVVVAAAGPVSDAFRVQLPEGALAEGTVRDPVGKPVPLATVRFFAPACAACAGAPAALEAQAHADANGHFRVVIPTAP